VPSKGVHVLAEAFTRLDPACARLAIHGGFPPYHGDRGYEAEVRRVLGGQADASLKGPFARAELGAVLSGLDVLVVPSLWEENRPLVVQEAFLAGLPVIASAHGGLAEMVRDGVDGLLFRPGDAADLAAAMRRLVDDPALRERLGRHAPAVPSMDEHVNALLAVYREAQQRVRARPGRVGVVVLDRGLPEETARAVESARDATLGPHLVVVENGPGPAPSLPDDVALVPLEANRGYAGGMNAGLAALRESGCDRFLLLNNDAVLEPGALRRLAEALDDDPKLAAVAALVRRRADGRVESRGLRIGAASGRVHIDGAGEDYVPREGRIEPGSLVGAAWMLRRAALESVGPLDASYFLYYEEVDWCRRALAAGWRVATVLGAVAHHAGGRTLGPRSTARLYYATRNHLRVLARHWPRRGVAGHVRSGLALVWNLLYALRTVGLTGVPAVLAGARDYARGRTGPR
jgi:GT2 family glycosyltransferase